MLHASAMGAPSKRARKIRTVDEFDVRALVARLLAAPRVASSAYAWSLDDIAAARNEQMAGRFRRPVRLAESMRTDDALFVARKNRLAPLRCLGVEIVPAKGARGAPIAGEGEALFGQRGIGVTTETLLDIGGALVDHGVAIGFNTWTTRPDGSRVDVAMSAWPMEFVRWDEQARAYKAQLENGVEETIVHGDGRWVVFAETELTPFKHGALLPAALVWARHAFPLRDWSKGSVAHGSAKAYGEMPPNVPIRDKDGELTAEAAGFLALIEDMIRSDSPAGLLPAGAKMNFVANGSTAWQVWQELVDNAEKAAARIYLGTDGTLGAQGGAPGVDISALFGVASTKVQGDVETLERCLLTGVIEPWCAVNFGDSTLAPQRKYQLPDPDEDARHKSVSDRRAFFYADISAARANGFEVTKEYVAALAEKYELDPVPALPVDTGAKAPSIALAPTDVVRVVSVNEARASAGLAPLLLPDGVTKDPDGFLTVTEYAAKKEAAIAAAAAAQVQAQPSDPVGTPSAAQ